MFGFSSLLAAALILASAGGSVAAGEPPAVLSLPQTPGPWLKFENLPPVMGADGRQHQATCSGFPGTDPRFSFWAKRGSVNNLVVFFDGGGACWDDLTCSHPASDAASTVLEFYVPEISPSDDPSSSYDGVADVDNPANPVRDWSMVFIPYCTGDVHLGSATRQYTNAGNAALPRHATFQIEHRGFDNFMVVLDWIRQNFASPEKILVAGSSAGGYGAAVNFPWIAETYPGARMHVLSDAGQGVSTPGFDQGDPGRNSWGPVLPPWVFGVDPTPVRSADLLLYAAQYYSGARVAQFTTTYDSVQIGFYGLMELTLGPGGSCRNPVSDWNRQMLSTLQAYVATSSNFRYYLARGTYHTIMGSPEFYSESSGGILFSDWMAAMLNDSGGTLWRSAACPFCLRPAPCR